MLYAVAELLIMTNHCVIEYACANVIMGDVTVLRVGYRCLVRERSEGKMDSPLLRIYV